MNVIRSYQLKTILPPIQDYFTPEMAEEFFRRALAWQEEHGYNVYHETHRKRFLHSPWVARSFMPKFPEMKVSAAT